MAVLSFLRGERLFILCDLLSGGGDGEGGEEEGGLEAGALLGWEAVFCLIFPQTAHDDIRRETPTRPEGCRLSEMKGEQLSSVQRKKLLIV